MGLGSTELIIILILVVILFGVGRISKIGNELGKGISGFREGLREGQKGETDEETESTDA